jgi:hypothetical protein
MEAHWPVISSCSIFSRRFKLLTGFEERPVLDEASAAGRGFNRVHNLSKLSSQKCQESDGKNDKSNTQQAPFERLRTSEE